MKMPINPIIDRKQSSFEYRVSLGLNKHFVTKHGIYMWTVMFTVIKENFEGQNIVPSQTINALFCATALLKHFWGTAIMLVQKKCASVPCIVLILENNIIPTEKQEKCCQNLSNWPRGLNTSLWGQKSLVCNLSLSVLIPKYQNMV